MVKKRHIKPEYIRHPFSAKKMLVLDSFKPTKPTQCPSCHGSNIILIKTVEFELKAEIKYTVVICEACNDPVWTLPKSAISKEI